MRSTHEIMAHDRPASVSKAERKLLADELARAYVERVETMIRLSEPAEKGQK